MVVRPNGYQLAQPSAGSAERPAPPLRRTLRLVHYGNLYSSRLDVAPLLARLAGCGKWDSVVFTQQGNDWSGALRGLPAAARVEVGAQQSWEQVVAAAPQHDLAIVVGNRNPAQLPSKAVQYLTLPIPRVAIVSGDPSDALSAYVRDKPGWMILPWDASAEDAAGAVAAHVEPPGPLSSLLRPRMRAGRRWPSRWSTFCCSTLWAPDQRAGNVKLHPAPSQPPAAATRGDTTGIRARLRRRGARAAVGWPRPLDRPRRAAVVTSLAKPSASAPRRWIAR